MTIKEAIITVLDEQGTSLTYLEVLDKINEKKLIDWGNAKTPSDTIGAQLGHFIRHNDSRVKRTKGKRGFEYYSSKFEKQINLKEIIEENAAVSVPVRKSYQERHLHKLLSSYLKTQNIFCKTIFHEKSANSKDDHQKWIHPDIIGIDFLNLRNKSSNALMKLINKADAFNLTSYEIKREIKSDYELKKCFFQAVSNSSWSNYGYLVAFEINQNLFSEMKRLNQSFGIGIIELKANPFESAVLFPSKYRDLDFMTIDKLCEINSEFEKFIAQTELLMSASEKYLRASEKELEELCDTYFKTDSEVENYCRENKIPWETDKQFK